MAGNVRNIIQGGAKVYLGPKGTAFPTFTDASASGTAGDVETSGFVDVGHTSEGLDITVEPDYLDVEVDLLLDSAALFKTSQRVTIATSFTEATLENFAFVIGQPDSSIAAYDKTNATDAGALDAPGDYKVLTIDGGALGDEPQERAFVAVGPAPRQEQGSGLEWTDHQERVYYAPRVISTETVSTGVKRNEVTMFPVTFRCLPDSGAAAGEEYGKIVDRLYGTSYSLA